MSNPPGAAPDELAHYLRAFAAGRGEFVLDQRPPPLTGEAAKQRSLRFQRTQTRVVEVPGSLSPELFNCNQAIMIGQWQCPESDGAPANSVEVNTWVGTYPPYVYAVAGIFMHRADVAWEALIMGRLASMLLSFTLIAAAVFLLYDPINKWSSLLGLMVGVTPMAVFVGSSLTPNGPEIAAGTCFAAALFRLTRPDRIDRPTPDAFAWIAAGLAGLVLVAARDLGPVWLLLYLLLIISLGGFRPLLMAARTGSGYAVGALALLCLGVLAAGYWQFAEQTRADMDVSRLLSFFPGSLLTTKEVARQELGVFGALTIRMSSWAYVGWSLMLVAVGVLALAAGNLRERAVLILACIAGVGVPVAVDMLQRLGGFGVQGRQVLPLTIAVPLLAGEIIHRHAEDLQWLERIRPSLWFGAVAAAILGYAWYLNSKFYMVGLDGPDPFWHYVDTGPPLGWPNLAAVAGTGAMMILLSGYIAGKATTID